MEPKRPRRYSRAASCLFCGYSRAGLQRGAPCPECGTLPAPRGSLVISESAGLNIRDGLGLLVTVVAGVLGLPALARGFSSGISFLGLVAIVIFGIGAYSLIMRLRAAKSDDRGDSRRWVLSPAGISVVQSRSSVRFLPWTSIVNVSIRPLRARRIKIWAAVDDSPSGGSNEELLIDAPPALTPTRLSRAIRGIQARGAALSRAAPPTTLHVPLSNELIEAVMTCPRCGRPLLALDASSGCPTCRWLPSHDESLILCGASSAHHVISAIARRYGLILGAATVIAAVAVASGRAEVAGVATIVLCLAVFRAVPFAHHLLRSRCGDRAWVVREDAVDICDRALTRRVRGRDIGAIECRVVRGGRFHLRLRGRSAEEDIDQLWVPQTVRNDDVLGALRDRVAIWRGGSPG